MALWGGDRKTAAVFLWVSLFFVLSGLLLYLIFSAPPDPPPHSHPVMAAVDERTGPAGEQDACNRDKGDDHIDDSSQSDRAGR